MSGSTIVALAVGALVFLAALVLFTTARRRDANAALSRETVDRDRPNPFLTEEEAAEGDGNAEALVAEPEEEGAEAK
jgi:hypothetical protein